MRITIAFLFIISPIASLIDQINSRAFISPVNSLIWLLQILAYLSAAILILRQRLRTTALILVIYNFLFFILDFYELQVNPLLSVWSYILVDFLWIVASLLILWEKHPLIICGIFVIILSLNFIQTAGSYGLANIIHLINLIIFSVPEYLLLAVFVWINKKGN